MKQFRIAIVGCGNISRMHFDAYVPHPDRIQIVAVCDTVPEHVQEIQQQYGVPQGFSSLEEMIQGAAWDVAVVCTPTHVRKQVVDTLAAAGKHIFVEKPFADSYQDAQHMVDTCQQAHVKLAVNQNFRYHYPFEMARQQVAQGKIGHVAAIVHQDLMLRQDAGWRIQQPRHALAIMGIHWFDGFRWILGDEATTLTCALNTSKAIQCTGETEAAITIQFSRGTLTSYVESFSSPRDRTETILIGDTGELVLTYEQMQLFDRDHRKTPREQWENPYRGTNKPVASFLGLDQLLTAIEQDAEPANSGRDNLKTVALLDGAYRSAETQHPVTFREGTPL
ncbi:oxidoreductase [Dictyobacter sp. S3.2.2.5]|uniref:Oxidoreductase n=1 Tax=Dictyobacter halimunensis TaxID=3026934 RepID=A0ABQ6FNC9_9CHLR|nr:oxidoreductase [Dictyobacter sp. S3.2.2.5]